MRKMRKLMNMLWKWRKHEKNKEHGQEHGLQTGHEEQLGIDGEFARKMRKRKKVMTNKKKRGE